MSGNRSELGTERGIVIVRASRLEALIDPLMNLMASGTPADILVPHTIVAAHPGVRQWLTRELAQRHGAGGVIANVDMRLPGAWLDDLASAVLGDGTVALQAYRRDSLRWRIHECLDRIDDARLRAYLDGHDAARRRFQLSDRLARIYTQYLVYRPDWLSAWEAGRDPVPESGFLAPLWRRLREQIGVAHRGERVRRLIDELERGRPANFPEEPLHVFGMSHLAPSELAMLRAVACHRMVALYLPDPCIEYWAGPRAAEPQLTRLLKLDTVSSEEDEAFLEIGHPLLASWGRMGQHLMLALAGGEDIAREFRDWVDEEVSTGACNRLESLQESVRHFDPSLIDPGKPGDRIALDDRSLRIHVCHTRLRELEVLRDALLRERSECSDLKPSDIVVMAPDIRAYIPLLGAVFGEAGRHDGPLPYHLADVPLSHSHRLYTAFATLLSLPQSRLTAPEIMDLVGVPEIARAIGLNSTGVEVLEAWLDRSRVAWGLDAPFRESFGVPGIVENTFAWAMDRLLAGYVFGETADREANARQLGDGTQVVPVEGVHGPQAEVIGALDCLLQILARLRKGMTQARPASRWAGFLDDLISTLFRVEFGDSDAHEARTNLHRFAQVVDGATVADGLDPVLDFSIVREVLLERLSAVPERQRFLAGGVTFCGMVPQRAIPFKIIAVLGLDDGEFPREAGDAGLDLMLRYPRIGDRGVVNDDRYLFLETLMAARKALHLSYIGEGVRDARPRNPAAPLAELMDLLDEHACIRGAREDEVDRPWLVRHPLQPFDLRYFDGSDPRLYSFDRAMAQLASDEDRKPRAFRGDDTMPVSEAPEGPVAVSLAEMLSYYRDPARQILSNRLNLHLRAVAGTTLRTSEPLDAAFYRVERVPRRLFLAALERPEAAFTVPESPPDWLRLNGLWPPGHAGERAYSDVAKAVQGLLDRAHAHPLLANGLPAAIPLAVDRSIGRYRVQGELARVRNGDDARWIFDAFPDHAGEDTLDFKQRVAVFIEWALLRLDDADGAKGARVFLVAAGDQHPWQDSLNARDAVFMRATRARKAASVANMLGDLERRLYGLLEFFHAAETRLPWYFPKTSWEARAAIESSQVEAVWAGGDYRRGERDYAPGYAALLGRDACFDEGTSDRAELECHADELFALIQFATATTPDA
ncbi:MAG: exodeoxyribonuclease V subunit gamma [Rhodanobacteraceae bacterium]